MISRELFMPKPPLGCLTTCLPQTVQGQSAMDILFILLFTPYKTNCLFITVLYRVNSLLKQMAFWGKPGREELLQQ